jgi:hypothetical protein
MRRLLTISIALFLIPAASAAQDVAARRLAAGQVPPAVRFAGRFEAGRQWRDRNGENLLLLTRTPEKWAPAPNELSSDGRGRELHAYHYLRDGAGYRLLWHTVDFIRQCEVDVTLRFAPGSLRITDVDADGIAESSFIYSLGCHGGVDPMDLKLILHEGATKYAIRGFTDLRELSRDYPAPKWTLDPALARNPALRAFAERQWRRFVRDRRWPDEDVPP